MDKWNELVLEVEYEDFDSQHADDMEVLNEFESHEDLHSYPEPKFSDTGLQITYENNLEINSDDCKNNLVKRSLKREFDSSEENEQIELKRARIELNRLPIGFLDPPVTIKTEDSDIDEQPLHRDKISEYISVINSDGLKTYLPMRDDDDDEPLRIEIKKNNLLSVPISDLKYKLLKESSYKSKQSTELCNREKNVIQTRNSPKRRKAKETEKEESMLWVEKYRPYHYMELMSDDGVNRTLLQWLKLWDKIVFNQEIKKPKSKQPATQNSKYQKSSFNINEELDEQNRPQHKVALLTGYPGLGKTTLSHVIAYHAGYNVVEMNASDDRNPEHFRNILEASTQMKAMIGEDPKPNCIIIDEIDGAPLPSINLLVSFVKSTGSTKGRKKKDDFPLLKRPIICICNDLYAPSLKPLRQIALILNFPPISTSRLVSRLQEICKKQKLKTDMPALIALCEKAENDIRSCLSTLQFVNKQNKTLKVSDVKHLNVGQKDIQKSLFSIWQSIFKIPQLKRKQLQEFQQQKFPNLSDKVNKDNTSLTARFYNILWMSQRCDYEILLQGLFENYPLINFKDPYLHSVENGMSWMCFTDLVNKYISTTQMYSLLPYISYAPVIFHLLFATTSNPQIKFPNSYFEFKNKEKKSSNILDTLHNDLSVHAKCFLTKETTILDLLSPLIYITQPTLRPVNTQLYTESERNELRRVINTLIEYNLNYSQQRTVDGSYEYVLEPNIEEIVKFQGIKSGTSISYAAKQLIAKEVELEKMRHNDIINIREKDIVNNKVKDISENNSEKNPPKSKGPKKNRDNCDFFGRRVEIPEEATNDDSKSVDDGSNNNDDNSNCNSDKSKNDNDSENDDDDDDAFLNVSIEDDSGEDSKEEIEKETDDDSQEGTDKGWKRYIPEDENLLHYPFTVRKPGFQIPIHNRPNDELGYFQLFFTDELLKEIVAATNTYALKNQAKNSPLPKHVCNKWEKTNIKEMKAFIGVLMNMALNPKNKLFNYFSEDWLDKFPFFKSVFSMKRFSELFWMLYPAVSTQQCREKNIKNLSDYINQKCRELFIPEQKIAIDESTIGYKGCVIWKCYNPKKPTKWGLRIYCLCSKTGYVSCFFPYYGRKATDNLVRADLPFPSRIVVHLLTLLLSSCNGSGFHIYTNRFYTSPDLGKELRKMKIHLTGSILTNKINFPPQLKAPNLQLYQYKSFKKNNKVMVLSYRDKGIATVLSTYHNSQTENIQQSIKRGKKVIIKMPKVILDYIENIRGVDTLDYYCGIYGFVRNSIKWWRKLFFWILEVSLVNSYLLWNIDRREKKLPEQTHLMFRKNVIKQLVGNVRNLGINKTGEKSVSDNEEKLRERHCTAKLERRKAKECTASSHKKIHRGKK